MASPSLSSDLLTSKEPLPSPKKLYTIDSATGKLHPWTPVRTLNSILHLPQLPSHWKPYLLAMLSFISILWGTHYVASNLQKIDAIWMFFLLSARVYEFGHQFP